MQSISRKIVKLLIAVFTGCFLLTGLTRLTMPKFFTSWNCPLATHEGFYGLKENTVDVLTLGSSYSFCSIDPQYLYDQKHIRAFDLGSGNQSVMLSYFWLKEALRSQSPKAVLLEADLCWKRVDTPYNMKEADVRRSIDYMHVSPVKFEAIKAYSEMDDTMTLSSLLFPIIRYHDRWKEFDEDDFVWSEPSGRSELKGFYAQATLNKKEGYVPYSKEDRTETVEMDPVSVEYLEKILAICRDNGINLILYRSPAFYQDPLNESAALEEWASANNVSFYDFNEESLYNAINYNYDQDAGDYRHCNIYGARKITDFMGTLLTSLGVSPVEDAQWENSRERYQQEIKDITLSHITDTDQFIEAIGDEDYTVFVSSKGGIDEQYLSVVQNLVQSLGIDPSDVVNTSSSLGAVVEQGKVMFFETGDEIIKEEGTFRGGKSRYRLQCSNSENTKTSEIIIDNVNQSWDRAGLNVVVYENRKRAVIDTVCIETGETGLTVTR